MLKLKIQKTVGTFQLKLEKKVPAPGKKYKFYESYINKSLHFVQRSLSSSTRGQRVIAQLNLSRE